MHGLMSYRCFARARSLRSDRAPARARSRASARARSLRSDRAEWVFGRYVATELWLELGRYVVTERSTRNVRAPGSIVSKTQSEAHSSPSSTRISGPSCTRPRSDIGETDHPPGSEYGSDLSGPWDRGITGAMSCLREACIEFLPTPGRTTASGSPLEGTPVPRIPARRNPGSPLWSFPCPVPGSPPSSGKWKTSDKENLPWGDPGTGPGKLHSGEPGFLIAGILGTGVPSSEDPKTGVLPGTRGITCPLKSTGVAYSQQVSLRQDIAPVIPQSRVPLRSVPYSEPGGRSVFPTSDRGLVLFGPLILVEDGELWASDGILETMEPGDLTFPEEELA
ncbi:hypothetical protein DY000_02016334 [Brassica cretica]|uniref:Uncharacterized protein n=1 Tax=Brassica cretica TaxID=69181 RepID=A0ABQ7CYH9_BRACR|nr:hypothetical protein DY000_02016334 [Brassica cretica]